MTQPTQNQTITPTQCYCRVPESIMTANRYELSDQQMKVCCGQLPEDLQGHVFIIAPVGSVNSGGLPYCDGDSLLNGDGMIYRLDFNGNGEVGLKTRLVKPPCYYADEATKPGSKYEKYQFGNHGIARFSLTLGLRNQLNTAFLPMKFASESQDRLLVTYDAGRPYEIDTNTLEVVTPVGSNQEWRGEIDKLNFPINARKFPFKSILSTAHPACDYDSEKKKGEMFTVNYGRSFINLLERPPRSGSRIQPVRYILQNFMNCVKGIIGGELEDFTYLIRWDGEGNLERWKLVHPGGEPVRIEQTIHQIGVTKDYVVLMDTAFIVGIEQVLNNPCPKNKGLEKFLRNLLEGSPYPDSKIYIVRRADLKDGQEPACNQQEVEVVVKTLVIPLEAAHFLVDYENSDGNITLHVGHICAMQVAEWLRKYDRSAYSLNEPVDSYLCGMEHSEMDIGRMGRYVINGETGELIESKVISDSKCTWAVDLYAYLDRLPTGAPSERLENVYWISFGLWRQVITEYIFNLYKDYKHRLVPLSELLHLAEKGKPACLFRLDTQSMTIPDYYEFDCGYMALSPQFVPRGDGKDSKNGYIVCTVCYEDKDKDKDEIWIFNASNLEKGPLCKLHHPSLKFGFTIHTAWLKEIGNRQAEYTIGVEKDYQDLVNENTKEIQDLFKDEVYPYFK